MKQLLVALLLALGVLGAACDTDRDDNVIERGGDAIEEGAGDLEREAEDLGD